MKGYEQQLIRYMEGASKRFIIPVYQRNYDWQKENCIQLYDDLVKTIKNNNERHFFGSIVSAKYPGGKQDEHLIIDGQQRLTTVSLLLLALHNLIASKVLNPDDSKLQERIYNEYLVDKYATDETRIKLKPVKNDQKAFNTLFNEVDTHIPNSNLTVNYNYFYNRIQRLEVTPDQLFDAIGRLEIICIVLDKDDNPQLIFESLNSTGLALTEGDKIRNFVLMGLSPDKQNKYYEKYWNPIEEMSNYDVSSFIRDYLTVKRQEIPSQNKIYIIFKTFVEESNTTIEDLLDDLLRYVKLYKILLYGTDKSRIIDASIYRLNRLETTVIRPFLLEVLRLLSDAEISTIEAEEILIITENYLFRRTMCELPTNALNKIFMLLHKEINRFEGNNENYLEKFKYSLISKKEKARFPDDDEFLKAFSERQVYRMNSKNKIYIMERLENSGTIEDKDIYRHYDAEDYSIEHIMPQSLTRLWEDALGNDYALIHEEWKDRIANLTLTAYNSKYSNSPFDIKRDMRDGFKDSGLRLNTWIANQRRWTVDELLKRNELLVNKAKAIWSYPSSSFIPKDKEYDSYTLDDDVDLTGRNLLRYIYKNTSYDADSWVRMYEQVLLTLFSEDKSILISLAYSSSEEIELSSWFSTRSSDLRDGGIPISENLYADKNTGTRLKISILRRLFDLYGINQTDLEFVLKEEDTGEARELSENERARFEYWSYALDIIKSKNSNNDIFKSSVPTKRNSVGGSIGIVGLSLNCTARTDIARVILILYHNKEINNSIFESLLSKKEEIEEKLGLPLTWENLNKYKGAYIYLDLSEVSVLNREDWQKMAWFHAEWSRKISDTFMPYLERIVY